MSHTCICARVSECECVRILLDLKYMNFQLFRDFSRYFLNFYEFKIDLFELNSLKYIFSITC